MIEVDNITKMQDIIENNDFVLFYLSKTECGMCKSLKPKIEMVANKYPSLKQYYVNLEKDETISGQFSIYTVPAILLFVNGKETIREARYMSIDDIDSRINRISTMMGN